MKFDGKILVVDDEDHVRKYVSLILRQALPGSSVLEARNGDDAVDLFQRERPSMVMMDVNMPGRDGIAVLEELRALEPESVIVMMTSLANRQTVEEALRLGATFYIRKDTPREEITASIKQIVSEHFDDPTS